MTLYKQLEGGETRTMEKGERAGSQKEETEAEGVEVFFSSSLFRFFFCNFFSPSSTKTLSWCTFFSSPLFPLDPTRSGA